MSEQVLETFDRVKWAEIKESFKNSYGEYPSVISLLFLVGLAHVPEADGALSKEAKQEVIHVGLCKVLEQENLYTFTEFDEDGWPHFEPTNRTQRLDIEKQENYIKQLLIQYFNA